MAKYAHDTISPYADSTATKKQQVAEMFNSIAFRYDFLNRFLSLGIDIGWRKKALKQLQDIKPQTMLDVATGTGDFAIMANKILQPKHITGVDISEGMLEKGKEKVAAAGMNNIELVKGDSESLPFKDNSFDAITVAFGVRNFEDLEKGLKEMYRVLKPGGKLVVLEFSQSKNPLVKGWFNLYMNHICPFFGKLFAKNKAAYTYLNHSMQAFPAREAFTNILKTAGYTKTLHKTLSLGICCIYCGSK